MEIGILFGVMLINVIIYSQQQCVQTVIVFKWKFFPSSFKAPLLRDLLLLLPSPVV